MSDNSDNKEDTIHTIHVPEDYDVIYLLFGYDENKKFTCTEADSDWSYDTRVHFAKIPERYVFLKKRPGKETFSPAVSFFLKEGKIFNTIEEAEGKKVKRNFFS